MRKLFLSVLAALVATPAAAGSLIHGVQDIRLLTGWRMANGNHMAAVEIVLEQGWKTYWRAPGPLGIPPRFTWGESKNLKSVRTLWPTPTVYKEKYGQSIGYTDFLVLPFELAPKTSGAIDVNMTMDFGICKDICIPARANLSGTLPVEGTSSKYAIQFALKAGVKRASKSGHKLACAFTPHDDGLQVQAKVGGAKIPSQATLVFEHTDGRLWFDQTKIKRTNANLMAESVLNLPKNSSAVIERSDIRVTMLGGTNAIEFSGCPAAN